MNRATGNLFTGLLSVTAILLASSCQKEIHRESVSAPETFTLHLNFKAVVDTMALESGKFYKNYFQEPYSVTAFKYYISHIEFLSSDADPYPLSGNNYYLIDAARSESSSLTFKPLAGKYDRISFTIGVDSTQNVSGAQTGALDPANGMFWTWNSGYIMAKLEGSSPLSTQPDNRIEYHIGGFKEPNKVLKKVEHQFPGAIPKTFTSNSTGNITITANINAWFYGSHELHIMQVPVCMTPGEQSKKIAENYEKMFRITNVANN